VKSSACSLVTELKAQPGEGIPLLPSPGTRTSLVLKNRRVYEKSGIVSLEYDVARG
jgi:hypothetical protein